MMTEWPVRISLCHSFADARSTWRAFEEDGLFYAFQSYDWLSSWQDKVGRRDGIIPCLASIEDERRGRLLFLPLGLRPVIGGLCLEWLGGRQADYHAPLLGAAAADGVDMTALWPRLLARVPQADAVHLSRQPPNILGRPNPFLALAGRTSGISGYSTRLAPRWEDYYAAKRGAKTRSTDRRKLRRLQEQGRLVFRAEVAPQDIAPAMQRLAELKLRHMARIGGRDPFGQPGCREFYAGLAAEPPPGLRVMISTLDLDGTTIAAHWGVVANRRFFWLVPVYDEAWRGHSPGLHLMHFLMEWCCGNGIEVFDFGLGDEDYKTAWNDAVLPLSEHLARRTWRGAAYVGGVLARRQAKSMLRRLPLLAEIRKAVRRRAAR